MQNDQILSDLQRETFRVSMKAEQAKGYAERKRLEHAALMCMEQVKLRQKVLDLLAN